MTAISQAEFRQAMAHLPASVNIITSQGQAGRCGITASAVCSVTDSPPTILVCVNRASASHPIFKSNGRLCVNVLTSEQEDLAKHFAGMTQVPMEERFAWDIWDAAPEDQPALRDALVQLHGTISDYKDVGSHSVIFITLDRVDVRDEGDSLVYFNRDFHRVQRNRAAQRSPSRTA
ncbi:4-hydroxyphenylacetate 3-monooxygenase reductase component [Cupriavidus sp. TA19]|uniref:4-hydroxyphenylacetate 3-monooxygenase, reductase component n=1 Tax=unclassified Cupriavidus TaxID=2640874 RepID=UPI000E2FD92E|nr:MULTISPECIES: 4-hydroxyphenylacetate 3-monooxygenase, reductase component [unclassified Cupriavidus]BDB29901.1 4-hydroxyphenylacetate 3-monooxygenase, reductase component [Cupriavidus sp. P-10]GLC96002.1 4-hydroxyphenylacetate 3-monooxygenase reductase component [Cupriavidus sp. TA19]